MSADEMETTAEERKRWSKNLNETGPDGYIGLAADSAARLLRDFDRQAARLAKLEADLAEARKVSDWHPTHCHTKSGGLYRVVAHGQIEADLSPVIIYEARDGRTWVQPEAEFNDGRFVPIVEAPTPKPSPDGAGRMLVYNEPLDADQKIVGVVRISEPDAIKLWKEGHPEINYTDESALHDFMTVNFAWFVDDEVTNLSARVAELEAEKTHWSRAQRALSDAYVRLRALIPGAFRTPHAPTPEQVWQVTEDALRALTRREEAAREEEREADYCYDEDHWSYTCPWRDRLDLVDGMDGRRDIKKISTLLNGPDWWVTDVPVTFDDEGNPDETKLAWFRSEAEAQAARSIRSTPARTGEEGGV